MATTKSPIDPDVIRALADILKETDLTEIEVEQKGLRVRVARNLVVAANVAMPSVAPVAAPVAVAVEANAATVPAGRGAALPGAVTSPMVGTAYRAPSPDKPNFVEVGAVVKQGQTLLIIEAMKTFNEIPAPRAGTITQVLVESGHPVEFGQALVVIE
jgi:acetyl-CoA carboxylase biotin carboxyl carrier protein